MKKMTDNLDFQLWLDLSAFVSMNILKKQQQTLQNSSVLRNPRFWTINKESFLFECSTLVCMRTPDLFLIAYVNEAMYVRI